MKSSLQATSALALAGLTLSGCASIHRAEKDCPTDARATYCAVGEEAIRQCPCGVTGPYGGYHPTCWNPLPEGWHCAAPCVVAYSPEMAPSAGAEWPHPAAAPQLLTPQSEVVPAQPARQPAPATTPSVEATDQGEPIDPLSPFDAPPEDMEPAPGQEPMQNTQGPDPLSGVRATRPSGPTLPTLGSPMPVTFETGYERRPAQPPLSTGATHQPALRPLFTPPMPRAANTATMFPIVR